MSWESVEEGSSPRALAIGGLDPSGGAGVLLDAFVLARLGYAPATVVTTVTAQNSKDFLGGWPVMPVTLLRQLEAVSAEGAFACVKVGAVGSGELAKAIAEWLCEVRPPVVVIDPVTTSSSGGALLEGEDGQLEQLLRAATLITPNAEETAALSGLPVDDVHAASVAAVTLSQRLGTSVLVTGVPNSEGTVSDVLSSQGSATQHPHPVIEGVGDVRGTGCIYASTLAARLGGGQRLETVVPAAQANLLELLTYARPVGEGRWQVDFGELVGATS